MREPDNTRQLLNATMREAGALALEFYQNNPKNWDKDDGTPVSEADIAVNDFLQGKLLSATPDYGWLSEESVHDPARFEKKHIWVVDPIDGTRAFLQGKPHWALSVALIEDSRPILAAVFNPAEDAFFEAASNSVALLNNKPISANQSAELENCKMLAHRHIFERDIWPKPWPKLKTDMRNSMAYRLCLVGLGEFDATLTLSAKSDWDLAAADLIVTQAGGKMTNGKGEILHYNQASLRHGPVIAAGPNLHSEILEYVQ